MSTNPYIRPEAAARALELLVNGVRKTGETTPMRNVLDNATQSTTLQLARDAFEQSKLEYPAHYDFPEINWDFVRKSGLQSASLASLKSLHEFITAILFEKLMSRNNPATKEEFRRGYSLVYQLLSSADVKSEDPESSSTTAMRSGIEMAFQELGVGKPYSEEETLRLIPEMIKAANQRAQEKKNAKAH